IPFVLDSSNDLIGTLQVTLSASAPGGSTVTLTIDPATATFSNKAGTTGETVAQNTLSVSNGIVTVTGGSIAAPTGLVATAASTTQVNLTWNAVGGADHYEIWRKANGGAFVQQAGAPTANFF